MTIVQAYPGSVLAEKWISGLLVSNDPVTPNTKLNISAGIARDSNNIIDMTVGVNNPNVQGQFVVAPLVLNALANGANGLDQGVLAASLLYAVYVIGDSTYQRAVAGLISLESNAIPLMPEGYDSYRLVGYARTDSSVHFLAVSQVGESNERTFIYNTPYDIGSSGGSSYIEFQLANGAGLAVPAITNQIVNIFLNYSAVAAGDIFNARRTTGTGQITVIAPVAGTTAHTTQSFDIQPYISAGFPVIQVQATGAGTYHLFINSFKFFV